MTLRRAAYNAAQRAERMLSECSAVPAVCRAANTLGWERIGFYSTHRQYAEQHVVPLNDYRPHAEASNCWCRPVIVEDDGRTTYAHFALDERELLEHGERRVQ